VLRANHGVRSDFPMNRFTRLSIFLLSSSFFTCSGHTATNRAHRVTVAIVRQESSIHGSLENRDAYLVRVAPKSGKEFVARMIDVYPGYAEGGPFLSLAEGDTVSVALRRLPYCDGGFGDEAKDGTLRCFEVIHGSWKGNKVLARDEWWK
jgi:hypothetical protein